MKPKVIQCICTPEKISVWNEDGENKKEAVMPKGYNVWEVGYFMTMAFLVGMGIGIFVGLAQ